MEEFMDGKYEEICTVYREVTTKSGSSGAKNEH